MQTPHHPGHWHFRVSLLRLGLALLLLQPPFTAASHWTKAGPSIMSLLRFKNSALYDNLTSGLRGPHRLPDHVDRKCRDYDAWRDPLSGSTPSVVGIGPVWDPLWDAVLPPVAVTREDLIMNAMRTLPVLEQMLNGYQRVGLFTNWHTKVLNNNERAIPIFVWSRPWSLKVTPNDRSKPNRLYTLLTTYTRILHYYNCVLKDEHNSKRSISEVIHDVVATSSGKSSSSSLRRQLELFRREGGGGKGGGAGELKSVHKRVFGIDNEDQYDSVEENVFLMMGQVYLTLPDASDDVIAKLTLENDVEKAIRRIRLSSNVAMRIYLRAFLCLELHQFLFALTEESSWLPDDDGVDDADDYADDDFVGSENLALLRLENKILLKLSKIENEVMKQAQQRNGEIERSFR